MAAIDILIELFGSLLQFCREDELKGVLITATRSGYSNYIVENVAERFFVNPITDFPEFERPDRFAASGVMLASRYGHLECVRILMDFGADIRRIEQCYTKALVYASRAGMRNRLRKLAPAGLGNNEEDRLSLKTTMDFTQRGQFKKVEEVLLRDANALMANGRGSKILSYLMLFGCSKPLLDILIVRGYGVDDYNCRGHTPLISAVLCGCEDYIDILMVSGADVHKPEDIRNVDNMECSWVKESLKYNERLDNDWPLNSDKKSALVYAVWTGRCNVVAQLLEYGADVNGLDSLRNTPLLHALHSGCEHVIKILVSHGADVNHIDKANHQSILYRAVQLRMSDRIVKILLDAGARVNTGYQDKTSPFLYAAELGNDSLVEVFLQAGVVDIDVYDCSNQRETALMLAAGSKSYDSMLILLDAGANPNKVDGKRRSVIERTAEYSDLKCLKLLIRIMDSFDADAIFHSAAKNGNIEVLEFVLKKKVKDVNAFNKSNETAVMCAVENDNVKNVKLLIAHGADINIRDRIGRTTLMIAVIHDAYECFKFLLPMSDIDCIPSEGDTLLMMAAQSKRIEFLKTLLEKGCKQINTVPQKPDRKSVLLKFSIKTVLINAVCCLTESEERVRLLLDGGADVNQTDTHNCTPLMHAVMLGAKGCVNCVKLLLDAGADVNVSDDLKRTVLHHAISDWECLELILKDGSVFDEDGKLRSVHTKDNIFTAVRGFKYDIRCLKLAFEYDLYRLDKIIHDMHSPKFNNIAFASVIAGISPYTFQSKQGRISSPLQEAILRDDHLTASYLLANLHFTIRDYTTFLTDKEFLKNVRESNNDQITEILNQLTEQPWKLETLCLLTISSSLSPSTRPKQNRDEQVDSLILPAMFKSKLKFKEPIAKLCSSHWMHIGRLPNGDEQNLLDGSKPIFPFDLHQCTVVNCSNCRNLGSCP